MDNKYAFVNVYWNLVITKWNHNYELELDISIHQLIVRIYIVFIFMFNVTYKPREGWVTQLNYASVDFPE